MYYKTLLVLSIPHDIKYVPLHMVIKPKLQMTCIRMNVNVTFAQTLQTTGGCKWTVLRLLAMIHLLRHLAATGLLMVFINGVVINEAAYTTRITSAIAA